MEGHAIATLIRWKPHLFSALGKNTNPPSTANQPTKNNTTMGKTDKNDYAASAVEGTLGVEAKSKPNASSTDRKPAQTRAPAEPIRILNEKQRWPDHVFRITCLLCNADLELKAGHIQCVPELSTSFFGGYSSRRFRYFVLCPTCDEAVDVASIVPEWIKKKLRGEKPQVGAE